MRGMGGPRNPSPVENRESRHFDVSSNILQSFSPSPVDPSCPPPQLRTPASPSVPRSNCKEQEEVDQEERNDGDCECMGTALNILEAVAMPLSGTDGSMVEKKVMFVRENIDRCVALSQCRWCRQDSGISMLNLVIYEKLTAACEDIADVWTRPAKVQGVGSQKDRQKATRYPLLPLPQQDQGINKQQQQHPYLRTGLGCYSINTDEEHRAILAAINVLQLQRLTRLLHSTGLRRGTNLREPHERCGELLKRRIKTLQETWAILTASSV